VDTAPERKVLFTLKLAALALALAASAGAVVAADTAEAFRAPSGPTISAPAPNGRVAVLVPVNYPLHQSGRKVTVRLDIQLRNGKRQKIVRSERPHAGSIRRGDKRQRFRFVHAVPLGLGLSKRLLEPGHSIEIQAGVRTAGMNNGLPKEPLGDDQPGWIMVIGTPGKPVSRAPARMCSTTPLLLVKTAVGQKTGVSTPRCGARLKWSVSGRPGSGRASVARDRITYVQGKSAAGADEVEVQGRLRGRVVATRKVQLRLSPTQPSTISVRAMGDSVTAGFGYYGSTGKLMPITSLLSCEPGATIYNDACSSNSSNRNNKGSNPNYLVDFGLSRNISWAAQWANEYGITDYRNYAISGSAPVDWLPGGQFDKTRQQIEQQNPDYILMTMGANPLLSDMLFGIDEMGCAIESDLFGGYRECIETAFASVNLSGRLNALYQQLIDNTSSRIIVMQYHLSIPSSGIAYSAAQIELMGELMNEIIAFEANTVSPERINVIAPPRFDVGIDMTPLYPAKYTCSWFDWKVDGPSVQADPSQDFLEALHPLSFCSGPAVGTPWVISGDTGIHPSAVGYSRMASQIPAPE